MALETASYIANLVQTNPDGGDARSTADDHLRLIKAVLLRTFPKLDAAVSLSAVQVSYVGDLSASVQAQINALRDGSATVNYAKYANSASNATYLQGVGLSTLARLDSQNTFTQSRPFIFSQSSAYFAWHVNSVETAYIQHNASDAMYFVTAQTIPMRFYTANQQRMVIDSDGTVLMYGALTVSGTITGTITNAVNASFATTASTASTATTATTAATATIASTCTSASSAALLSGYAAAEGATADTIVKRTAAGYVFANYFNQNSTPESQSIGHVACMTNTDGYWRTTPVAFVGTYLETRNITGRSGVAKTLSTSTPSGGSNGDIWYRY